MACFWVKLELDDGAGLARGLKWLRRALYLTRPSVELLKQARAASCAHVISLSLLATT